MIVDATQPFLDVAFFEQCARAAKAVARLQSDTEPLGTAFLIARDLVLTAYQNLFDGQGRIYPELGSVRALFDYAAGVDGAPLAAVEREGDIGSIIGEPEGHWAVMRLVRPAPRRFPTLAVNPDLPIVAGRAAHLIHHPEGERKKVGMGKIVAVDQDGFSYATNTTAGSSGAPVFNEQWELIGLHYRSDHDARLNGAVSIERVHRSLRSHRIDARAEGALSAGGPPEVYISACGKDRDVVEKLEAHLAPLRRAGRLSVWHQGRVAPGASIAEATREHLRAASVVLLVTSADYLSSDDTMAEAIAALALPHRPTVIPVLARPCLWEQAPFGALQPLPEERQPLLRACGGEDAFVSLARAIGAVLADGEF